MKTFLVQRVGWSGLGDLELRKVHGVVLAEKPEEAGEILGGKYVTPDEIFKALGYDHEGHISSEGLPVHHLIKLSQGGVLFAKEDLSPSAEQIRGATPHYKTLEYRRGELHFWTYEFEGYAILLLQEVPSFSKAVPEETETDFCPFL